EWSETEAALVGGILEHRSRRGVDDRAPAAQMLLAETLENLGTRGVAIAEHAGQIGLFDQGLQQLRRKAVFGFFELAKGLADDDSGGFPVAGWRVLAAGAFAGISIQALCWWQVVKACGQLALVSGGMRLRQSQATQIGQAQRTARRG